MAYNPSKHMDLFTPGGGRQIIISKVVRAIGTGKFVGFLRFKTF